MTTPDQFPLRRESLPTPSGALARHQRRGPSRSGRWWTATVALSLVVLTLTGCPPQRRDAFENMNLGRPAKDLTVAVVFSENTKNSDHYAKIMRPAAGGMDTGMIFREIPNLLGRHFKSVIKVDKMEEADSQGVDLIAVVDIFLTVPRLISMRNVKVDMKVFILTPDKKEIDMYAIHTKKLINPLGNTPIGPWVWGATIKAAAEEALGEMERSLASSAKLAEYALSRSGLAGTGDSAATAERQRLRIGEIERRLAQEIQRREERAAAESTAHRERITELEARLAREVRQGEEKAAMQTVAQRRRIADLESQLAQEVRRGEERAAAQSVEDRQRIVELERQLAQEIRLRKEAAATQSEEVRERVLGLERKLAEEVRLRKELEERQRTLLSQAEKVHGKTAAAPARDYDVDKPAYMTREDPDLFALVIGIERYAGVPDAEFAERDSAAVREHLLAMGYPPRNIIYLTGAQAGRASIAKYVESWLPRNLTERSTLFVYYSGHGAPDLKIGHAYLVPWDGDVAFLEDTGYPLRRIYEKLNSLKARQVVVVLDACFSGAGGHSVLPRGARPLATKVEEPGGSVGKLIVFSAAAAEEITGTDADRKHGLFTYHFLSGLSGAAADSEGRVTVKGLYDYLTPRVRDAARRQNRDQTPQLMPVSLGERAQLPLR